MRKGFFKGVLLGLTLAGLAFFTTTALAGSGVGGIFNLGVTNTVDATSHLNGTASNAMLDVANAGTGANSNGIVGRTASTLAPALAGVNSGAGVGARGTSVSGSGIYGQSTSGPGARGISASGRGVHGTHSGTTGTAAGVYGESNSTDFGTAGVSGTSAGGRDGVSGDSPTGGLGDAGVRGTSEGSGSNGVIGIANTGSNAYGVWGTASQGYGGNFSGGTIGVEGSGPTGVHGSGANIGVYGNSGPGNGVQGTSSSANGVQGTSGSTSASGVYGENSSSGYGVAGRATASGTGVWGETITGANGGYFDSGGLSGNGVVGVANNGAAAYGVWGLSSTGTGVVGSGSAAGVSGSTGAGDGVYGTTSGDTAKAGVRGLSFTLSGNGIIGEANNGSVPYGVWGKSTASGGYAGFFSGNVYVGGTLSKAAGSFKIDNPLDPAHSYLQHSFVESPQMMNVYNGTVTTDGHGFATVKMPNYFQALNRTFRYQLTVVGRSFAQAIVWNEIAHNQFTLRTNQPNIKVSWQVTGVRHDAYANAHRIKVLVPKAAREQGFYLHPELYGKSAAKSIEAASKPGAWRAVASASSLKPVTRTLGPSKALAQPKVQQLKKLKH